MKGTFSDIQEEAKISSKITWEYISSFLSAIFVKEFTTHRISRSGRNSLWYL